MLSCGISIYARRTWGGAASRPSSEGIADLILGNKVPACLAGIPAKEPFAEWNIEETISPRL